MKIKSVLPLVAGLMLAIGARAQSTNVTSALPALGVSDAIQVMYNSFANSGIFTATNWGADPYLTYSKEAKDHVGGGILLPYNMPSLSNTNLGQIAPAIGVDYLGSWSLVSGNVTLKIQTHPLKPFTFLPASISDIALTPVAIAGLGTPLSGSAGAATLWDLGYSARLYSGSYGNIGAGLTWGEWMNAGSESGHRWHIFLSWSWGY